MLLNLNEIVLTQMTEITEELASINKQIDVAESDMTWFDEYDGFNWYWQNEEVSELLAVRDLWLSDLKKYKE